MDLSYLNHSLYPRAVNASVEGHLRRGESEQKLTARSAFRRHDTPAAASQPRPSSARSNLAEQRHGEQQAAQGRNPDSGQVMAGYAGASDFGAQMKVASRQARQSHARRGYHVPALVSARGREANRRYLETSLSNQHRFIDEMV